jgi:hypothetical protein
MKHNKIGIPIRDSSKYYKVKSYYMVMTIIENEYLHHYRFINRITFGITLTHKKINK